MLTLKRTDLLALLKPAAAAVSTRLVKPVLGYIFLRCQDGRLSATGSDLEFVVQHEIPHDGEQASALLSPKALMILAADRSDNVSLELDAKRGVTLRVDQGSFTLRAPPCDEFPVWQPKAATWSVTVVAGALKTAVARTAWATEAHPGKHIALSCVAVMPDDHGLVFVGTEGHVLAYQLVGLSDPVEDPPAGCLLIPHEAATRLAGLLGDGPVTLEAEESWLTCHASDSRLTVQVRRAEGQYPIWRNILEHARRPQVRIDLPADVLLAACEQVGLVVGTSTKTISGMDVRIGPDGMILETGDTELGSGSYSLPMTATESAVVRLQPRNLAAALRVVRGDSIRLAWCNDNLVVEAASYRCFLAGMRKD